VDRGQPDLVVAGKAHTAREHGRVELDFVPEGLEALHASVDDGRVGDGARWRIDVDVAHARKYPTAARAIGSPCSWTKCPACGSTSGSGQPRMSARSCSITGAPSTGSSAPTAMKVLPSHFVRQNSRAARETAAPSASGRSGTIC